MEHNSHTSSNLYRLAIKVSLLNAAIKFLNTLFLVMNFSLNYNNTLYLEQVLAMIELINELQFI